MKNMLEGPTPEQGSGILREVTYQRNMIEECVTRGVVARPECKECVDFTERNEIGQQGLAVRMWGRIS